MITIENLYEGRHGRVLAWALYAVCGLFLLSPALDLMAAVMPPHLRSIQWRFGLMISVGPTIMTGVISLAMFAVLGVLFGHRLVLRTVGVVSIVLGASYVLGLGVFGLDLLQLRNAVPPDRQTGFWITSLKSLLQFLTGGTCLLLLGFGSMRVTKRGSAMDSGGSSRKKVPTVLATRPVGDGSATRTMGDGSATPSRSSAVVPRAGETP